MGRVDFMLFGHLTEPLDVVDYLKDLTLSKGFTKLGHGHKKL